MLTKSHDGISCRNFSRPPFSPKPAAHLQLLRRAVLWTFAMIAVLCATVQPSSTTIQVQVGERTGAQRTIALADFAPGIFTYSQDGRGAAVVLHGDGVTPVNASSPARPGEIVVLYATGLGAVTPPLATGEPSAGNQTVTLPLITIDDLSAEVLFSGAAPGFVGLYQVNFRVPPNTRSDPDVPLLLSIGGKQSNAVTVPIAE